MAERLMPTTKKFRMMTNEQAPESMYSGPSHQTMKGFSVFSRTMEDTPEIRKLIRKTLLKISYTCPLSSLAIRLPTLSAMLLITCMMKVEMVPTTSM